MKLNSIGVLFSFCLVATVFSSKLGNSTSTHPFGETDKHQAKYPVVNSGNYVIAGCGDHTNAVIGTLYQLWDGLQLALKTPSTSTVYTKFFNDADPEKVNTIFAKIALGLNLPHHGKQGKPTIVCANPDMPEIAGHWELCQNPKVKASAAPGKHYVFLCPRVLSLKKVPDSEDCVGMLPDGLYSTGHGLAMTQLSILLHELVHIYLGAAPQLEPEINGLHAVLDLPASESVINPANYVFYVANIMARCTKFNPPESLRPPERWLLHGGSRITTVYNGTSGIDREAMPSPSCVNDSLEAGLGECPGMKASATFTVVTRITSGAWGSSASLASTPPTA